MQQRGFCCTTPNLHTHEQITPLVHSSLLHYIIILTIQNQSPTNNPNPRSVLARVAMVIAIMTTKLMMMLCMTLMIRLCLLLTILCGMVSIDLDDKDDLPSLHPSLRLSLPRRR